MCKTLCVSLFADIIIRSSDIDLEFVKMLQHPSATAGSSHRTILTASDGTNHVVYNLHTMSPNSNIISCDSIEEETTTVTPMTNTEDVDLTVRATLDDDLNEFVICEKADSKSPGTSSYNVVVVAASQSPVIQQQLLRNTMAGQHHEHLQLQQHSHNISIASTSAATPGTGIPKDSTAFGTVGKFECSKCGSKFSAQRNMKRHYHHECGIEPKHGCEYCPMRFKRKNLLKYHILRKHVAKS